MHRAKKIKCLKHRTLLAIFGLVNQRLTFANTVCFAVNLPNCRETKEETIERICKERGVSFADKIHGRLSFAQDQIALGAVYLKSTVLILE